MPNPCTIPGPVAAPARRSGVAVPVAEAAPPAPPPAKPKPQTSPPLPPNRPPARPGAPGGGGGGAGGVPGAHSDRPDFFRDPGNQIAIADAFFFFLFSSGA